MVFFISLAFCGRCWINVYKAGTTCIVVGVLEKSQRLRSIWLAIQFCNYAVDMRVHTYICMFIRAIFLHKLEKSTPCDAHTHIIQQWSHNHSFHLVKCFMITLTASCMSCRWRCEYECMCLIAATCRSASQ